MHVQSKKIAILMPCYNENHVIVKFLDELFASIPTDSHQFEVFIVDDKSQDNTVELLVGYIKANPDKHIILLELDYNVGHQAAIYQGLLHIRNLPFDNVIILDSDGEDDPRAIDDLLNLTDYDIVHVARKKRKEGILFQLSYLLYKLIFLIITGRLMNIGNYTMIKGSCLSVVTSKPFVHFAAHLSKLKCSRSEIAWNRRERIDGKSKMNFKSLAYHGFYSLAEYAEDLLFTFLKLFVFLFLAFSLSICYVLYEKLFTTKAILGWTSILSVSLFNGCLLCIGFFVIGLLLLNLSHQERSYFKRKIYKIVGE